jgi:penicillin-binding protein 1A
MAGKGRSGQRIEPSFAGNKARDDDELTIDADDRIGGRSSGKTAGKGHEKFPKGRKTARHNRGRQAPRREGLGFIGTIRRMIYWCLVLMIWVGIGIGGMVLYYGSRMPSASTWQIPARPPNVKINAMDGAALANRGTTGGEALTLQEMSPFIPEAIVAIEDRRFYSHFGVDPIGLARAFATNLMTGHTVQGGSTLTQQLAKNLFLSPERTMERKVQEVLLALWLEHTYTKDQILAMYLNRVFFGSNAFGVEAASRRYFNKSARDVNLGEAAMLAGLVKAPSKLSPIRDPAAAGRSAGDARPGLCHRRRHQDGSCRTADAGEKPLERCPELCRRHGHGPVAGPDRRYQGRRRRRYDARHVDGNQGRAGTRRRARS